MLGPAGRARRSGGRNGRTGPGLKIGELSARSGVTRDTIRFYERAGVLPAPRRTESGHRTYGLSTLARLRFIHSAKLNGLTLEDIRQLLHLSERHEPQALRRIATRLRTRADAIDHQIAQLRTFRRRLVRTVRRCAAAAPRALPAIERLFGEAESFL